MTKPTAGIPKLGFVGLGKYGWALMRAILRRGHHRLENVFWECLEESEYSDNLSKLDEVKYNFAELHDWLKKQDLSELPAEHEKFLSGLISTLSGEEDQVGILFLSLNRTRGQSVLEQIGKEAEKIRGTLWLLSSISQLDIVGIRKLVTTAPNIRIIRYLENMGIREGAGIIAAYAEKKDQTEGVHVLQLVFQGLGKIILLDREEHIDAARVITGSTIGMIAWYADALTKAIRALEIEGLGKNGGEAEYLVYHSLAGALALARARNVGTWTELLSQIRVLPGAQGQSGTTDCLIRALEASMMLADDTTTPNENTLATLMHHAYRRCLDDYREQRLET